MKKEILRKCISTGEIKNRNLLFRIVKTPTGDIKVDFTYRANGRGAYISKNKEAIEIAKKKKLLSKALECNISDEIYDYYCVSQCLPGIIAVNMAILVGYRLKKFKGALVSLFAMSLSPFVSIVIVAILIQKIMSISFIEGLFWGVNVSVIILIYLTIKDMWEKSIVDFKTLGWFLLILTLFILKVSPVLLIIVSIAMGLLVQLIEDKKNA